MAKQPLFDVLEDFLEMDSRPWKVKKNPIFSMPEASGKTSFLNKSDRTKNSAPHYDESFMGTSRKKMVRKDAKAEKKKPETRKLDIRKISLVRIFHPLLRLPFLFQQNRTKRRIYPVFLFHQMIYRILP